MKCIVCEGEGMMEVIRIDVDPVSNEPKHVNFEMMLCPECLEDQTMVAH